MRRVELGRVTRRLVRVAVQHEVVEATLLALDADDALGRRELRERRRGHVVRGVELAALQRGDHGVGVPEDAEDDLVDRDLAPPEARVRLHPPELPLLPLLELERAGGDIVDGRVRPDVVRAHLLVDVLRQDVHGEARKLRIVDAGRDHHRAVVRRLRLEIGRGRRVVQPLLVARAVDGVRDVLRGQRRSVGPLEPFAQRVGPGLSVLGAPGLGEAGGRREVRRGEIGERRVANRVELVRRHELGDRRIGSVEILREPDGEDDLLVVRLGGCRGGDAERGENDEHCD